MEARVIRRWDEVVAVGQVTRGQRRESDLRFPAGQRQAVDRPQQDR